MRIPVHFALIHQTFLALVDEFDRILNGQNVFVFCVVDVIHHGSEGRALTRAGRPCYRNQPTGDFRNLTKNIPHTKLLHGKHFGRDRTKYSGCTPVLDEGVNTETRQAGNFKRKVSLQEFFIILSLLIIHDFINERMNLLVVHLRHIDTTNVSIHSNEWRHTRRNM